MDNVYRTPDAAFADLADFPYAPNYLEWDGLRTHYVDEGPRGAPVALLLHGEPSWSYLYRKMIPRLLAAGYLCVAPDHIGFGRSDKVTDDAWYVIDCHIDRLAELIQCLDLRDITMVVQVCETVQACALARGAQRLGANDAAVSPRANDHTVPLGAQLLGELRDDAG
jgi:haloalkane dehalogenase